MVIGIPSCITGVETKAVYDAAMKSGAGEVKVIEESESYLTTFKGVQGFLFNVCKNLGEDRPSKSLEVADFIRKIYSKIK